MKEILFTSEKYKFPRESFDVTLAAKDLLEGHDGEGPVDAVYLEEGLNYPEKKIVIDEKSGDITSQDTWVDALKTFKDAVARYVNEMHPNLSTDLIHYTTCIETQHRKREKSGNEDINTPWEYGYYDIPYTKITCSIPRPEETAPKQDPPPPTLLEEQAKPKRWWFLKKFGFRL